MKPRVRIKDLVSALHFQWLVGHDNVKKEEKLLVYGVNRPGFELMGFFPSRYKNNQQKIMLLSFRENELIKTLDRFTKLQRYQVLMKNNIPLFIFTKKFNDPDFLKLAIKNQVLVVQDKTDNGNTAFIQKNVLDYMDPFFSKSKEVHGSLVDVYGIGILILGVSGIGKSELILELIKRNHLFVGDDRINVFTRGSILYGTNDEILKSLLEVRGIGIIDISTIFGHQYMLEEVKIDLVIKLYDFSDKDVTNNVLERLGEVQEYTYVLDVKIPFLNIPLMKGRNMASLVETAVAKFKFDRQINDNSCSFVNQLNKRILKKIAETKKNLKPTKKR